MKEWGMLSAPGQPVHVRTQGLYSWERTGREVGEGLGDVLVGGAKLAELEQVQSTGELAAFTEQLRAISAEVSEELQQEEVKDWDYAWNAAMTPRIREAVQELSAESRAGGLELARVYSAQSSIEAQRDRELRRVTSARGRWEQQVEASVAAGHEEQAARWLQAGRGVFVPEAEFEPRLQELRSRACRARWESRLQAAPLEALRELKRATKEADAPLPGGKKEREALEQSCERLRRRLRRELAQQFSERLRAGEELDAATLELAAGAGLLPEGASAGQGASRKAEPTPATRSSWRRWVDEREEGEEADEQARLTLATAPLPLAERRALLTRLERSARVPMADRRALSRRLFASYSSGAFGCPGDAEAARALLSLQDEGAALLAEQGAGAVSEWMEARCSGGNQWVCFENEE